MNQYKRLDWVEKWFDSSTEENLMMMKKERVIIQESEVREEEVRELNDPVPWV